MRLLLPLRKDHLLDKRPEADPLDGVAAGLHTDGTAPARRGDELWAHAPARAPTPGQALFAPHVATASFRVGGNVVGEGVDRVRHLGEDAV